MTQHSRICAHIDMDAFEHNLDEIETLLNDNTSLCAVIKADGYGHGAVPLALRMEDRGRVWGYAVATMEEAAALREAGAEKPILLLGHLFPEDMEALFDYDVRPSVCSVEAAQEISDAAGKLERTVPIHIKIDTGMNRVGFQCTDDKIPEVVEAVAAVAAMPHLTLEGIFSHFSMADETDKTFADRQEERFSELTSRLNSQGINIPIKHLSNSAAIIDLPQFDLDLVRAGIILYGIWPSDEVDHDRLDLAPILSLTSHIVQVKDLQPGSFVSYGGTFISGASTQIATIPVGYADGYPRSLSNKGAVLIHGQRAPIVGRICMDMFMVNITGIEDVSCGDPVTLIGRDGDEEITLEELASRSGRFPYEFACDIGKRVPRVYESKDD